MLKKREREKKEVLESTNAKEEREEKNIRYI